MMITTHPPSSRVRPQLPRDVAMRLAETEYRRTAEALAALGPEDWTRPTDCPAWDVRQMACHTIGMAAMTTSPLELARQQRKAGADAKSRGIDSLTALTALQVSERAGWTPDEVVAGMREVGPKAYRGRRRTPGFVRNRALPEKQVLSGQEETWSIGYLIDVILTRDPWMHRMDIARATGRAPELTAEHDGVIVADVVAEWASRHDEPYQLELTGPAGGTWRRGAGGEQIRMDAIDFCRALSGRGDAPGLLSVEVPF